MIEFLDTLIESDRTWLGLIWLWGVGAPLLWLAGGKEGEDPEERPWLIVPAVAGLALVVLPTVAMALALFARFTAYVFGGV